jgi:hypothetical protein
MVMPMSRTIVDVDLGALEAASIELGTKGVSATVNAALRQVGRRQVPADFDVVRDIDGTPTEIEASRQHRDTEHQV